MLFLPETMRLSTEFLALELVVRYGSAGLVKVSFARAALGRPTDLVYMGACRDWSLS